MSRQKRKRNKGKAQILTTTKEEPGRLRRAVSAIKKGITTSSKVIALTTVTSSSFVAGKVISAGNKVKEVISNVKAGEKLADECAQVAEFIKEATDKAELLSTVKVLRTQANTLEALARSK